MPFTTHLQSNAFGEAYFPDINGELFTERSARQQFQQYLEPAFWQEDTCHLIIGSDSGLLIEYVQQQGVPAGSTYLFIEPEALQRTVTQQAAAALAASPLIRLCGVDNWITVAEPLGLETYILKKRVLIHHSLAARVPSKALYQPLLQQVSAALDTKAYAAKLCLVDRELIERVLENVADNHIPVATLAGKFHERTAIILGAGPSLETHIPWIREQRTSLVVIAASRLCQLLIHHKIIPDIVVSIDSQPINFELSKELFHLPGNTLLIHSNHVSPSLISQWGGLKFYAGERVPWLSEVNSDNLQDKCGPTVTNTALVVAAKLGFTEILLCGVDFCSLPDSPSHSGSEVLVEYQHRNHAVVTNDGQTAYTNVQMLLAANTMAAQAATIIDSRIINIAATACKIPGVEYIPAENIQFTSPPAADWRTGITMLTTDKYLRDLESILDELQNVQRDLKKMRGLIADAKGLNKKIYKRDQQGNYNTRAKSKLDNLQQRLDTEFAYLNVTVKKTGIHYFIDTLTTRDISQFSDRELERQGQRYYQAYDKSVALLSAWIDEAIRNVELRQEEEKPSPDMTALVKQWDKNRQPGRAMHWIKSHPSRYSALATTTQSDLDALAHWFQSIIYPTVEGPQPDRLWHLINKIGHYAMAGRLDKLQSINAMYEHRVHPRARSLYHLSKTYTALLNSDPQAALEHFEHISENDWDSQLLSSLVQAAVDTHNMYQAEKILMALSQINDNYMPQYARLLRSLNRIVDAVNAYTGYLQCHPNDVNIWLQLGDLYAAIDEQDMARAVYAHVLEHDPENVTARTFMNS